MLGGRATSVESRRGPERCTGRELEEAGSGAERSEAVGHGTKVQNAARAAAATTSASSIVRMATTIGGAAGSVNVDRGRRLAPAPAWPVLLRTFAVWIDTRGPGRAQSRLLGQEVTYE
jgi:hypothetical protein